MDQLEADSLIQLEEKNTDSFGMTENLRITLSPTSNSQIGTYALTLTADYQNYSGQAETVSSTISVQVQACQIASATID